MDKTVARLNIEHFRKLFANEADKTKRQLIARLLAEEEAKLARLEKQNKDFLYSRQCEGRTSIRSLVSAFIHPSKIRRHGNTSEMCSFVIDIRNLNIAVERRRGNRSPLTVVDWQWPRHTELQPFFWKRE